MNHAEEHTLDLYVLNPELLDADLRTALREHLDCCAGCRNLAETIRAFYNELDRHLSGPGTDVRILMRRIFPAPPVLRFSPSGTTNRTISAGRRESEGAPAGEAQDVLLTRSSSDGEAEITIRRSSDGNACTITLTPNTFASAEGGIVSFAGDDFHVLLDESGEAKFSLAPEQQAARWHEREIIVRFPVAQLHASSARVRREGGHTIVDRSADITARVLSREGAIDITIPPATPERQFHFLSVNNPSRERLLIRLENGAGSIPAESMPEELFIDIYA
ncbi:MAG: hypothetical protein WB699_05745 [Bacteroidota bacterium]